MTKTKVVYVGPVLVLVLLALVIIVGFNNGGLLTALLINGVIGIIILMLLNYLPQIEVPVNIWTFLIAAIGGLLGVAVLVILNLMGYKEW
ncbi:MAG: pro-sigmaK processing inhibitor BofA family protein [archaeon]